MCIPIPCFKYPLHELERASTNCITQPKMPNSTSISCLATVIWCFILLLLSHSFSAPSNETDRLALLAIKSQLHDPFGVMSSWNNSITLCQWTGVTCGKRHRRVSMLVLRNQSIGGIISPHVGNLSFLRIIDLQDNNLSGEIPNEVGRLFRLETLVLANNHLTGKIPANLSHCSKLINFFATKNKLVGEIPAEIGYLFKLQQLDIAENHLTGHLPASIGNLSALQLIAVRENNLSGTIPNTIGQLRNLGFVNFGRNQFFGMIPPSIYNISSLQQFFIHMNRFNGSIQLEKGINLPNLLGFVIHGNNFSGSLPYSLSNASNLVELDISRNIFSGTVSINFSRLKNLSRLLLGENNLGSKAPNDLDFITLLTNCTKLKVLSLRVNRFRGVLPKSIANLSITTAVIVMGRNQISGTIPLGIANLVNLNRLGIEYNQLTGTIPHVIGDLKNLQSLFLNENFLEGEIPSSLGNLTLLATLSLRFNNLKGNIPSSLGNCKNLIGLALSKNKLTGVVPPQIFSLTTLSVYLHLSDNLLNESLSLEVGNLKNLVSLDISRNRFSGEIPTTLGACTSLEYFYMQGNSFRGSIPLSLNSLKSINVLDVSNNNLSGQIPEYLENLLFLEYLNLSYNDFEGEVPTKGVFNNRTRVSLSGNEKLCGGLYELHLSSCPSKRSKKPTASLLIKVVIPTTVSCLILLAIFILIYARRRRSSHKEFSDTSPEEQQFPMVSYAELSKATNEFSLSNMIGQGSYGTVYKGILGENGILVAVKVLNLVQKGALRSFVAECEALRNIRHRNLIKIITVCSSIEFNGVDFKALVYEYMQKGNLEQWLHKSNDPLINGCNLSLIQRLNIAIDVASGIEYLHHHCQPPIIHGDIKPSNVLLDDDLVGHVGDFGLARFLFSCQLNTSVETSSNSLGIKGTVGYLAPEYGMGCKASLTGDVYSFGILLLEMFTRKRPTDGMFQEGSTLHEFCKMDFPEKVMEIVDASMLLGEGANNSRSCRDERVKIEECLVTVIETGVVCSMESPIKRMEMKDVVAKLYDARKTLLASAQDSPQLKFF